MKGNLHVVVPTTSHFLSTQMPFTVRDTSLSVVHRGQIGQSVALDEGVYSVDTMSLTGVPHSVAVTITAGETTVLDAESPTAPHDDAEDRLREHDRKLYSQSTPRLKVRAESGCEISRDDAFEVEIAPTSKEPVEVPTVIVDSAGQRVRMSVPLNPRGHDAGERECLLRITSEDGVPALTMTFASGRTVSKAVEGLVRHRTVTDAGEMFDTASNLLLHKYSDPAGATLGALALHGMGRLAERLEWVGNLAKSFPWIPDGRIVHAALRQRSDDRASRVEGLYELLDASLQRPMYTDGLSLAMELLRRWPDDEEVKARRKHLEHLADLAAYADWNSINLATRLGRSG